VINQQPAADNIETLMIMPHDTPRDVWTGARDVSPLAAGVAIYGLASGLLAAQAGFVSFQVGVMGAIVFAGGSQIVAVQQVGRGCWGRRGDSGGTRSKPETAPGHRLDPRHLRRSSLVAGCARRACHDRRKLGAHAGTARQRPERRLWYLVGGGLCLVLVWCLATVAGVIFARAIPEPQALGMDFAFTAAFIAIARSLWKGRTDLFPWLTAMFVVAASVRLVGVAPSWALMLGGVAGAGMAGAIGHD
jgi:predicted branched-subunit amino acid permease